MPSQANFLIVHGTYGSPEENWFPWLAQELRKYGNVFVPQFPTPKGQNLEAWLAVANQMLMNATPENTILIGHSLGATLVLRMAEKTQKPFKAVFAICPFACDLGNPQFDPLNASFYNPAFNWTKVAAGAAKIVCYAGDNDPYVPLAYPREIAEALNAELITVPKGGHLNAAAGYREFPALLKKIRQLL